MVNLNLSLLVIMLELSGFMFQFEDRDCPQGYKKF